MKRVIAVALLFILSGCAYGTDYVHINTYTPKSSSNDGSGYVVYVAKAQDNRAEPQFVGQKPAGYVAMEKNLNLSKIITFSVLTTIESAGYDVKYSEKYSDTPPLGVNVLNISIDELWSTFVGGFWTVDGNARAKLTFELDDSNGRRLWKKVIGKGDVESNGAGIMPQLFEDSLNGALRKVMDGFSSDIKKSDFKKALLKGVVVSATPPAHRDFRKELGITPNPSKVVVPAANSMGWNTGNGF